ncbi:MAG: ROK family protein, partial [Oscillospiraceae bacterium]
IVLYSCNLGFNNTDLRTLIKAKLGKEVYVENDANAAAFGEVLNGAGKGYKDVIVVTLGTGVGGGIIIDGKIYTGFNFCGAELGHTVIQYGGRQCGCGRKGCFEAYSSATALINMTKEAMEQHKDSKMWELAGGDIANVDGKTAFDGWRAGDAAAAGVVDMYIEYLGCGLTNIVNTFQPEVLLIGGGICKEGENLTKPLNEFIKRESYCIDPSRSTRLDICKLGNDAGIIGAAYLYTLVD